MLTVRNFTATYQVSPVLYDISFDVKKGETVGIVGESGSGKSTLLKAILRIAPNLKKESGSILWQGKEVTEEDRGRTIGMIFQNAALSMDPVRKVRNLFYETAQVQEPHKKKKDILQEAERMLEKLQIREARRVLDSYPFELSGGMCQRVAIAAALMNQPELLLADEPTSDLDTIAAAQVVSLLGELQKERHFSMILVTHNMGVAAHLADRIAVLYQGRIVEMGEKEQILNHPEQPYTKELMAAVPKLRDEKGI